MRLALGSDHAGYRYKRAILAHLEAAGHEVVDCGTDSTESVDYPPYIVAAAERVARGDVDRGIVLGGSGNGEAMAANRLRGIRCALCWDVESARMARLHNDANMISLGERMMPLDLALQIVDTWLATPFEAGRHVARIRMLDEIGR